MGDDIGAGEVGARCAQLALHLLPEAQVQIDRLIVGAVEGAHGRLAHAAAGRGALFVDHDLGRGIAAQLLRPDVVDIGADDIDEAAGLILGRADLALLFGGADAAHLAGQLGRGGRVDAEDEIADQGQYADADAAARDGAAAKSAPILDPAACPSVLPAHDRSPCFFPPKLGLNAGGREGMRQGLRSSQASIWASPWLVVRPRAVVVSRRTRSCSGL